MRQTTLFGFAKSGGSSTRAQRRSDAQDPRAPSPAYWGSSSKRKASAYDESSDSSIQESRLQPTPAADEASPRRAKKRRLQRKRPSSPNEDEPSTSSRRSISPPVRTQRVHGATARRKAASDSEEAAEDGEEGPTPRKRKLGRIRPATPETESEDDLDEDQIIDARLRTRDKKSAYMRNLERLKRKRDRSSPVAESSGSNSEEGFDQEGPETIDVDAPFAGARPSTDLHDDNDVGEEDSDEFIVEDDEDGVRVELPVAFNMDTHQDMHHHFKIICQMFVHALVAEDSESFLLTAINNQYFSVPLQATRRKLQGIRDSLVASSIWKTHFRRPLERLPDYETTILDFSVPGCDACSLGGRLSTRSGRLSGRPYNAITYEPLVESDDEESDDGSSTRPRRYDLGRFCATRAAIFHQFSHWEYKVFHSLKEELCVLHKRSKKGYVTIRRENGTRPPEDLADADGLVDWLEDRGVIENEYKQVKDMISQAHKLESAAKKGEDDGMDG